MRRIVVMQMKLELEYGINLKNKGNNCGGYGKVYKNESPQLRTDKAIIGK